MNENQNVPLQMSQQFADLVFLALDHGINSVKDGGALIPFIIYGMNEERKLHRYAADTFEESLRQARLAASTLPPSVPICAIAYDGYVTIQNIKQNAVIVEASEQGKISGVKLAQRYAPKGLLRSFRTIENPLNLGVCDCLLRST